MTSEDKTQDQKIADVEKRLSQKVPWVIFVWVIGIGTAIGWYIVNAQSNMTEKIHQNDIVTAEIRRDVGWIRETLERQEKQTLNK